MNASGAMLNCAVASGAPPGAVLPAYSFTRSVVFENCDALVRPTFVRYVPVPDVPVMKILLYPVGASSEPKLYQGMPAKSWPTVGGGGVCVRVVPGGIA